MRLWSGRRRRMTALKEGLKIGENLLLNVIWISKHLAVGGTDCHEARRVMSALHGGMKEARDLPICRRLPRADCQPCGSLRIHITQSLSAGRHCRPVGRFQSQLKGPGEEPPCGRPAASY